MINANFIQKILDISEVQIIPMEGNRNYSDRKLLPVLNPVPDELELSSLSGLVGFCRSDEGVTALAEGAFLHIESYNAVSLVSKNQGEWFQRSTFARATRNLFEPFKFNGFHQHEDFIIMLQSRFIQTETTKALLRLVGNIQDAVVKTMVDDGTSQEVRTRQGISMVEAIKLPNPVSLMPFRTFLEVDQPESAFVLRLQGSAQGKMPSIALYEADGGMWKMEAVGRIKEYLRENLPGVQVIA